jgi:putative restriction endonuclease
MIKERIPLIYFFRVLKGKYLVSFPVYVIHDSIKELKFTVAVDDINQTRFTGMSLTEEPDEDYIRRRYITSTVKIRLHQRRFRERVVRAYKTQCSFCRIKHNELLDAAHIVADSEELGEPAVSNGLSLCKIHHAAFDSYLIGITPDYIIKIKREILEEIDGPMLKYGIQSLEGQKIILPNAKGNWPDKDKLSYRFEIFTKVP